MAGITPRKIWNISWRAVIILALLFFSYQMYRMSVPYTAFDPHVDFLKTKFNAYHIRYWRIGFYMHVFSSVFVLLAGLTQFSATLMGRFPKLHKGIGWSYVLIVLLISGPGAFVMALHANGGHPARVSFTLQTILWYIFTGMAFYYALRRKFTEHGEFMLRSYALTFAAITLRAIKVFYGVMHFKGVKHLEIYITIAWLSWVPNIILAEVMIRLGIIPWILKRRNKKRSNA